MLKELILAAHTGGMAPVIVDANTGGLHVDPDSGMVSFCVELVPHREDKMCWTSSNTVEDMVDKYNKLLLERSF